LHDSLDADGGAGGSAGAVEWAHRLDRDPVWTVKLAQHDEVRNPLQVRGGVARRSRIRPAIGCPIADHPGIAALHRLCHQAVVELGVWGVCVSVLTDGGPEVLASSGADAQALEELQFVLGEGPTGDALSAGRPVLVSDLTSAEARWLQFATAARGPGVGGVYAFPLQLGGLRLGVLTIYGPLGEVPDQQRLVEFLTVSDSARELLLDSVDGSEGRGLDISDSLPLRTDVYQAQGMLMEALGITLADALARLRAMAYADSVDINELAVELVHGTRPMPMRDGGAE